MQMDLRSNVSNIPVLSVNIYEKQNIDDLTDVIKQIFSPAVLGRWGINAFRLLTYLIIALAKSVHPSQDREN